MSLRYDEILDGVLPRVDKMQLLSRLRDDIPGLDVLHTDEQLHPYECDGLSVYRAKPLLVVLPRNVEQVQAVMRLAHEVGVPVVARGAARFQRAARTGRTPARRSRASGRRRRRRSASSPAPTRRSPG